MAGEEGEKGRKGEKRKGWENPPGNIFLLTALVEE